MAAPPPSEPSETSEPFPITRYSSQDWWRVLKELPSSAVLVRIAPRMAANVVVATLVAWLRVAGLLRLSFPALPHQLAGAFLPPRLVAILARGALGGGGADPLFGVF